MLRDISATQGLGGISLGSCEDLAIVANRIEHNGETGAYPVCGIFVGHGECVEITHNVILDNGPIGAGIANQQIAPGRRGGIVLDLVTSFAPLDIITGAARSGVGNRPAARIHENVVEQPVGQALSAVAFGPLSCSDNAFSSELSGLSDRERFAGTVHIYNLGGVQYIPGGIQVKNDDRVRIALMEETRITPAEGAAAGVNAARAAYARQASAKFERTEAAERVLPDGFTQFTDNQSRTGDRNTSATCHVLYASDDLGYQNNQSSSVGHGRLVANGYLYGNTLRAIGNRMREKGDETMTSLTTLARQMNDTSLNQSDHCIIATDMNLAMPEAKFGNQVLSPSKLCPGINRAATLLFRPLE
jgi:hypothetical protein